MKKLTMTCLLVIGLVVSNIAQVHAEKSEDFRVQFNDLYVDEGIEPAVFEAVRLGITAYLIMEAGMNIENMNPQDLIKAMYCAGITGSDIRSAAEELDVTNQLVVSGFSKSIGECEAWVVGGFVGLPMPSGGGVFASTSHFVQN